MERVIASEVALDVRAELAEGPVWDESTRSLLWSTSL